jgi:hypothetical protein
MEALGSRASGFFGIPLGKCASEIVRALLGVRSVCGCEWVLGTIYTVSEGASTPARKEDVPRAPERPCRRLRCILAYGQGLKTVSLRTYSEPMRVTKAEQSERLKRNEEKWSKTLMEAGWTVLPSIILEKQHALGLDAVDINILLQLARYWWYSDNPPRPSKATIATCLGVDKSTVRRHIARMEADGFIKRQARYNSKSGGQETNTYLFDGLIKAAMPHAEEFIAMREKQRGEDADRRKRKKPRLVVDNTSSTVPRGTDEK